MRRSYKKEMIQLRSDNGKIVDDYLEKLFNLTKSSVNHYPTIQKSSQAHSYWDDQLNKIKDFFYSCLTDIYANTSKELKSIFIKVKDFNIKSILDLTYKEDGKTLDDRIKNHWDKGEEYLITKSIDNQNIKNWLFKKLADLLVNESKIVEEQVKKNKRPILTPDQYMISVVAGCDCPECGTYPGDDYPTPPFHLNCPGYGYSVITDDPDDIIDLDLEEEDIE